MSHTTEIDPRLTLRLPRVDKAFIDVLREQVPAPLLSPGAYKNPEQKIWDEARYDLFLFIERSTPTGWALGETPKREPTSDSSNTSTESTPPTSTSRKTDFRDIDGSISPRWWTTRALSALLRSAGMLALLAAGIILGTILSGLDTNSFFMFIQSIAGAG